MTKKGYKEMIVWEKADELALRFIKQQNTSHKEEILGIISQLRKASPSVPTNIVEG